MVEAGHALTSRRACGGQAEMDGLGGLDLKTTVQAGFTGWAQNWGHVRYDWIGKAEGTWNHRELALRLRSEGSMSVR